MFRNDSHNSSLLNRVLSYLPRFEREATTSTSDQLDWFQSPYQVESVKTTEQAAQPKFESYYDFLTRADSLESQMTSLASSSSFTSAVSLSGQDDLSMLSSLIDTHLQTNLKIDTAKPTSIKSVKLFQKVYYKEKIKGQDVKVTSWRMKEKMKTISAALVLCLNIGVEPPDVVKTTNSSKLMCWVNQANPQLSSQKILEMIGAELHKQYERWQAKASNI
ncbi:regulatory-associated of mTOR-like [Brachionus plicatilis]|uniref:Regulatory-associated of mTOR-like n=1 Tax=Brachionus plicatilis TaxID=10195 RepID=A0A3M7PZH5_BRAPC|nr:regulatory-associated of mTOR-like [Brachionus plicatilis]